MSRYNNFDEQEYAAFILNESRIKTNDRELDEHDPGNLDLDMQIFNTDEI